MSGGGDGSTGKSIRRVVQPVVFHLRSISKETGAIRVVRDVCGAHEVQEKRRTVEFYRMDEDDGREDQRMQLSVKTVSEVAYEDEEVGEELAIIVDSGADALLFPGSLLGRGERARGSGPL